MYDGFRVEVENITRLTEEQCRELHKELAVLPRKGPNIIASGLLPASAV